LFDEAWDVFFSADLATIREAEDDCPFSLCVWKEKEEERGVGG
jgi:hypothetical protein